jgi:hypothetical protein
MPADPKPITFRNKKYEAFIRGKPCLICGQPSEPCHVRRLYYGAGVSQKPHSYVCIPGCRTHHKAVENLVNTDRIIINLLMEYIERGRK